MLSKNDEVDVVLGFFLSRGEDSALLVGANLGGACDRALYFGGRPVTALGELVAVTLTPDVGV
jgi:hypothetical protein